MRPDQRRYSRDVIELCAIAAVLLIFARVLMALFGR